MAKKRRLTSVRSRAATPGEDPADWETADTRGLPSRFSTAERARSVTSDQSNRSPVASGGLDAVTLGLSLREVLSQLANPDYELSTHRRHGATVHEGVDRYAQRRSLATPEPVDDLRRDGYAGGAWCCGTFHARG